MDKFTRQLNLVALLEQAGTELTLADIRERLRDDAYPQSDPESARRAFERDKADLLRMGVPLTATPARDDPSTTVYGIDTTHTRVDDPGFTPEELAALRFAATAMAVRSDDATTIDDALDGLRKYGGLGRSDETLSVAELNLDRNVNAIFTAILDGRIVGFDYNGEVRRVLPLQLASRGGRWYLRCVQISDGESRTYRLDRIDGPVLPAEDPDGSHSIATADGPGAVAPTDTLRFRPWEFGDTESRTALVRLDPAAAAVTLAGDPSLEIHSKSDEGTTLALAVRNPQGLWPWLLEFLERAELLEPADLREQFAGLLESMAAESTGKSR
ncbi:MAG: helix-turn-helix transcriptional regulator [Microthrixaceae bacterium]